jgi:nitroreductase
MGDDTMVTASDPRHALAHAADAARHAPSIHNTQPWRWVVRTDALELHAERHRQLHELDPESHMLLISCGAALHHACVALAAEGWAYEVERPAADPLATVRPTGRHAAGAEAMRHFQAMLMRRTDRRVVTTDPVSPAAIAAVEAAGRTGGIQLSVVRSDQRVELAVAVERAQAAQAADPRQRAELAQWVGGRRDDGSGVPDSAIPTESPATTVAERDFGRAGTLPAGSGHDTAAVYAILHGTDDRPGDWLRAGEALSAAWLAATEHGLALLPFSAPTEVDSTRQTLRRMLSGVGYPYLALRLGAADPDHAGPPHTPRLPVEQVVDIVD